MSEHTSLPWTMQGNIKAATPLIQGAGRIVARMPGTMLVDEANAEFIVRACNSHDDLLAALEKVRDKAHLFGDESDNGDAIAGFEHIERLACAAIDKAKEKSSG